MENPPEKTTGTAAALGVLFQPKNLLKTVASQIPFASAGVEMLNQLDGEALAQRVSEAETKLSELHQLTAPPFSPSAPAFREWSHAASEFVTRTADLAVVYDSGFHERSKRGRVMVQTVGHACLIGNREALTCSEAIEILFSAAKHKGGRAIVIAGMAWYDFEAEQPEPSSGICICRLTHRDDARWQEVVQQMSSETLPPPADYSGVSPIKFTLTPWIGQEIGFFHSGEAKDIILRLDAFSRLQFDTSVISHFRRSRPDGLKTFVSGVLGGRVCLTGSPVFSRDGTLLGILSQTENYNSDAGRRAVVRGLLGHPRYTKHIAFSSIATTDAASRDRGKGAPRSGIGAGTDMGV